ncbi:MAG: methyltransferase domain-containing protein [Candidatus Eremiobacteraeota bacterium]|nr:methyltransferase domain-containing protein [Candidatus Eremiobacteraeota bacterium]
MRVTDRELMDDPVESIAELEGSLRDIELANHFLGGSAPVRRAFKTLNPRTALDIGTGSSDIPLALVRDAARRGADLQITCLDSSAQILEIAARRTGSPRSLHFVRGIGESLPFSDGQFDVVMCNLALHHFNPKAAVALLREMRRVARVTPLLCDLRRSPLGFVGAYLFSRIVSNNRLTRHDAPLSSRRAYTPSEARELCASAGWQSARIERMPFYRMLLRDG